MPHDADDFKDLARQAQYPNKKFLTVFTWCASKKPSTDGMPRSRSTFFGSLSWNRENWAGPRRFPGVSIARPKLYGSLVGFCETSRTTRNCWGEMK